MESMRGFDIFMKVAKRLSQNAQRRRLRRRRPGPRLLRRRPGRHRQASRSRNGCSQQDDYDLSRFIFLGLIPPPLLAELFDLSDLHLYLTVPFVLSWSLMDALACGADGAGLGHRSRSAR